MQLATYNDIKARTQRVTGWGEGVPLHLAASMAAGLVSTTVTSPGAAPVPPSLAQVWVDCDCRTLHRIQWLTIRAVDVLQLFWSRCVRTTELLAADRALSCWPHLGLTDVNSVFRRS